ncbi:MAG: acetyl-CoA carboxylase biotin carboxyl carrier protein subunit [Gammaproteobacteria bacterium]|nr:acetyl-CoA carboxylase biotin carboxyl carrier protein subunit [Gammaproteobacteria bacterium]
MSFFYEMDGARVPIEILARRPALRCRVDDVEYIVEELPGADDGACLLRVNGEDFACWRVIEGGRVHLKLAGRTLSLQPEDPLSGAGGNSGGHELRAEMPGVVVALRCEPGVPVAAGEGLLVIESMKMQITLAAPRAGIIATVHVELNETFQKGALLVALHPEEAS